MKAYLEELRRASGRTLEKRASGILSTLNNLRREALGFESNASRTISPFPVTTLASIGGATRLPTTIPKYKVTLLPDAQISPEIGIGLGGLQTRLVVKRRPDEVPKNSIVGAGLDNQRAVGSGADLDVQTSQKGS